MLRDKIKDREYFDEYIEFNLESIDDFSTDIENSDNATDIERLSSANLKYALEAFSAMYSRGDDIEALKSYYSEVSTWFKKGWNGDNYMQLLWVLSLAILLEVNEAEFEELVTHYESRLKEGSTIKDYLTDYLISSRQTSRGVVNELAFNAYQPLAEVTRQQSKEQAAAVLKSFVDAAWYKAMKAIGVGWYDAHKSKHDIYFGYWTFESAAVAKVMRLDDTVLNGSLYYPYDLVHWAQ